MATAEKNVDYKSFKGGVMSPTSQQTFAELRRNPPVVTTQKLIFDEESFEQSFLKCAVCHERFDRGERLARLLPCHHSFCFECINKCFQKEVRHRQSLASISDSTVPYALSISCPSCSTPFILTEEGLGQLATDHRIVQLLDFIGETDRQTVDYCSTHASQPLNFFCEMCIKPICRDCTVIDHKKCSEKQMVLDIDSAVQKYGPVLEKGIKEMDEEAKTLKEKRQTCEKAVEKMTTGNTDVCKEIKEAFEKLRKALNDREEELMDLALSHSTKGKDTIEEKIKLLKEKEALVEENAETLKRAKAEGKVKEMFSAHQKLKEYKSEPPITITDANTNDQSNCTFSGTNQTTLLSRISEFGDISASSTRSERGYNGSSTLGGPFSNGSLTSRYSTTSDTSRYGGSSYTGTSYSSRYVPRSYRY